jgi:hypothetical protein
VPILLKPDSGPPDLVLRASAAPALLPAVSSGSPIDTTVVTLTVENRFTPYGNPVVGKYLRFFGSDARDVLVYVDLPPLLAQVGNILADGGFQCGVTGNNQTVFCWNGTIPAGASVDIQIEVRSVAQDSCSNFWSEIRAHVDPYGWIPEAYETNNDATTAIFLVGPC